MYYLLVKETCCDQSVSYSGNRLNYVDCEDRVFDHLCLYQFRQDLTFAIARAFLYVKCADGKHRIYSSCTERIKLTGSLEDYIKEYASSADASWVSFYHNYRRLMSRDTVFFTENWAEMQDVMKEQNIAVFKPFESDGSEIKQILHVENMDEEEGLDVISRLGIRNVKRVNLCEGCYVNDRTLLKYDIDEDGNIPIFSKKAKDWYNDIFFNPRLNTEGEISNLTSELSMPCPDDAGTFFYVKNDDTSVTISKIEGKYWQNENCEVEFSFRKTGELHYDISRQGSYCRKYMKKSKKDISPLQLFNINTKNICSPYENYIFKGSANEKCWFIENSSLCRKLGFLDYMSSIFGTSSIIGGFVLFISIIYEYPCIELLIKSGYMNLIEEFFNSLKTSINKDVMRSKVEKLEKLVDKDATTGKLALRVPAYIGAYLKSINAPLPVYIFWRDIYEIENISKENFEKLVATPEFAIVNAEVMAKKEEGFYWVCTWEDLGIADIIKYPGYTIAKTIKYVVKMYLKDIQDGKISLFHKGWYYQHYNISNVFSTLKDTLDMADVLGIEVEPYPSNLKEVHDELSKTQQSIISSYNDEILQKVAAGCREVVEENVTAEDKSNGKFVCVFPENQKDFTQEGINQHNCVSGYSRHVASGSCVVFFVRNANIPDNSYITAELRTTGLKQVMFSNNRRVPTSSDEYAYCKLVAKHILDAYEHGKLNIFNKVTRNVVES